MQGHWYSNGTYTVSIFCERYDIEKRAMVGSGTFLLMKTVSASVIFNASVSVASSCSPEVSARCSAVTMKAVSEFDQYNIERLPEDLLHGILAQVSFHDRSVLRAMSASVQSPSI